MSEGWDMAATSVAEETLPWQPGLAMVHFRVAGSEVRVSDAGRTVGASRRENPR